MVCSYPTPQNSSSGNLQEIQHYLSLPNLGCGVAAGGLFEVLHLEGERGNAQNIAAWERLGANTEGSAPRRPGVGRKTSELSLELGYPVVQSSAGQDKYLKRGSFIVLIFTLQGKLT